MSGHDEERLQDLVARLDVSPPMRRERNGAILAEALAEAQGATSKGASAPVALLVRGDSITPEPITWLWPDWLAAGKLHILAGAPGTGKTTVALSVAAIITSANRWPDGSRANCGCVVMWSGEDDPADVLIPRLIASGADMGRVHIVQGVRGSDASRSFDPATDADALATALAVIPDVRLLIVDPISSAVAGDSHKNTEVRRGLQPLVDLAAKHRCALLGITHLSKGTAGRDPVERVTGSLAFGALARVVMLAARERPEGDNLPRRLLLRAKSNIGPDSGGFAYDMVQAELPSHPGIIASSVVWGLPVDGTARELLAEAEQDSEPEAGADAADFLRDLLAEGPRPAKEVYREAEGAGYSRDSMKRAKGRIAATVRKAGMSGGWVWSLPQIEGSAEGSEGSALKRLHSSRSSGGLALASESGADL